MLRHGARRRLGDDTLTGQHYTQFGMETTQVLKCLPGVMDLLLQERIIAQATDIKLTDSFFRDSDENYTISI